MAETRPAQSASAVWLTFAVALTVLSGYAAHAARSLGDVGGVPYRVLGSFYASGLAASRHMDPYGFYPLVWHFHAFTGGRGPVVYDVNLSPPCMLPLFELMARFSLRPEVVVWTAISTLLFAAGSAMLLRTLGGAMQKRQVVWLLLAASVTRTLWFGQDYAWMFLLACAIWSLLRAGRDGWAAVLIGVLIAMKPNLGLWPMLSLVAGYRRVAVISAASGAVLSLYPLCIWGPSIYREWLHAHALVPHAVFPSDLSLAGVFTRLGLRPVGVGLALALGAALLVLVRRNRSSESEVAGIAACAGILCAPLAWSEYVLFAAPFFVGLGRWGWMETIAALLLGLPNVLEAWMRVDNRLSMFLVALPRLLGLGLMLYALLRDRRQADIFRGTARRRPLR